MKKIFKGIRKKGQGNKFIAKYNIHVITSHNVEQEVQKSTQSDVVIHNKLCNGGICQGLRHWRLLSNLKNNFSKPVRNDIGRHPEGTRAEDVRLEPYPFNASVKCPKDLSTNANLKPSPEFVSSSQLTNKFYPQLLHTDSHVSPQLNGSLCITGREGKKNHNELINLSTYRLIDFKKILRLKPQNDAKENIKILVPQCPSALMPLKKKFAFTLAEVLITLGIIGVVAAMTIPTLMTKIQSAKLKSEYKEAYATIAQAVKMYNSDDDRISLQGEGNGYRSFMKYFTGATDCGNTTQVADDSEYCFVRQSNVDGSAGTVTNKDYQYKNYSKKSLFITTQYLDDGQFYLQKNNMLIAFNINIFDSPNPYISVDINGKKNKPNAWGHDVFTFELVQNEKEGGYELLPQGAIGTTLEKARNILCDKNSKDTRNGVTCSYFAQNNPTYFDNLPK